MPAPHPAHAAIVHTGPDPRRSMLFASTGVTVTVVLGMFVSMLAGAFALSATLIICAIWRARAVRATRAAGIAVRSRGLDIFLYAATGIAIAILALTVPYQG